MLRLSLSRSCFFALLFLGSLFLAGCGLHTRPEPSEPGAPAPALSDADDLFRRADWRNAAAAYDALTRVDPTNGMAWCRLGHARLALGQLELAIAACARAAEFGEVRAAALFDLACAQASQGDADESLESLARALDAGFHDRRLLQVTPALDAVRSDPRFAALVQRAK